MTSGVQPSATHAACWRCRCCWRSAHRAPRAAAHAGTERDEEVALDVGLGHHHQAPVVGDVDRHATAAGAGADAAAETEAAADVGVEPPPLLQLHADAAREVAPYEMPGTKSVGAPSAPARMRTNGSCAGGNAEPPALLHRRADGAGAASSRAQRAATSSGVGERP